MQKSIMVALAGLSMLATTPVFAQGIGHSFFMRGSIVETDSKGTVVCIGKADGADPNGAAARRAAGQSLEDATAEVTLYRFD